MPEGTDRRVALVTGAGRRLGKKLAIALAEKGFDVALHYHHSRQGAEEAAALIRRSGGEATLIGGNISSVSDLRNMAAHLASWSARLDLLVNNAGIFPTASFEEVGEELWDETMNTNLRSMFFLTQSLLPLLHASPGSSVVNVASLGAYQPWVNHIPYCISKAGVVMLTRALAKQLAPRIRVNAVAPGIIVVPGEEERTHIPAERIPLGRYGTPDDFIRTILFLAEPDGYITGQVIPLDGGQLTAV